MSNKTDKRRKAKTDPGSDFIKHICELYEDSYDDRIEDSSLGGADWVPGTRANHQSLAAFQKELRTVHGIDLSSAKIRKILITGGLWSTERSREVAELYERYKSVKKVAELLGVTEELVTMYLPYEKTVYDLLDKSGNAKRIERWRKKVVAVDNCSDLCDKLKAELKESAKHQDWKETLWKLIIVYQGEKFMTTGRGDKPGIEFSYSVSEAGGSGGHKYEGKKVDGFGNELFIIKDGVTASRSISRSTVEVAMKNAMEVMNKEGCVSGPRKLGVPGARSYLYGMFVKFGVIK